MSMNKQGGPETHLWGGSGGGLGLHLERATQAEPPGGWGKFKMVGIEVMRMKLVKGDLEEEGDRDYCYNHII